MTKLTGSAGRILAALPWVGAALAPGLGCSSEDVQADEDPVMMSDDPVEPEPAPVATDDAPVDPAPSNGAGMPLDDPDCQALASPTIGGFDEYDGVADPETFTFYMNGLPEEPSAVLVGYFHVGDDTGTPATTMAAGASPGYAIEITNSEASNWGGAITFYFQQQSGNVCINASAFQGLRMSIRGASGAGVVGVSLNTRPTTQAASDALGVCEKAAEAGECWETANRACCSPTYEVTLPASADEWLDVDISWSSLLGGAGSAPDEAAPADGTGIISLTVSPFMDYSTGVLTPGPYQIVLDNLTFY